MRWSDLAVGHRHFPFPSFRSLASFIFEEPNMYSGKSGFVASHFSEATGFAHGFMLESRSL